MERVLSYRKSVNFNSRSASFQTQSRHEHTFALCVAIDSVGLFEVQSRILPKTCDEHIEVVVDTGKILVGLAGPLGAAE